MTKVLGLDLDGVLYRWHEAVYEYFRMYKNYTDSFSHLWEYDYKDLSKEDWEFLINIDFLYSCEVPTPDCISFLNNVKYRFDIYYVTGRPLSVKTTTEQFLKRYKFPFRENLIFASDKQNTIRRLKINYFIDDLPYNLEELSKVTNVIMLARPYNREFRETYNTAYSLMDSLKFLNSE